MARSGAGQLSVLVVTARRLPWLLTVWSRVLGLRSVLGVRSVLGLGSVLGSVLGLESELGLESVLGTA